MKKIIRSSKVSLKFATQQKKDQLKNLIESYQDIVNQFIVLFWGKCPKKSDLLKPIVNQVSGLSFALRQNAARHAIDLIQSQLKNKKKKKFKPQLRELVLPLTQTAAKVKLQNKKTKLFDAWVRLTSLGGLKLSLPIKLHRQFNRLNKRGNLKKSITVYPTYIVFFFEIVPQKNDQKEKMGIDSGIKKLASLSNGQVYGTKLEELLDRVIRKKHGSKGQYRARRRLRHYIDREVLEIFRNNHGLKEIIVEDLRGITQHTKRRLVKKMRRFLGSWNYRYWLNRLKWTAEENCVTIQSVAPAYTSQRCPKCNHVEKKNRKKESFKCRSCGYEDDADHVGSLNVLDRFLHPSSWHVVPIPSGLQKTGV